MKDGVATKCEECGASVYKEHLESGIARYERGKLMCAHCVAEYESSHDAAAGGVDEEAFAPIEFDDGDNRRPVDLSESRIHTMSEATLGAAHAWDERRFKRSLSPTSAGATRCRTFHCKLSEGAIEFLNTQINDWLENNEQVVIKFATSTIGMFEGKHTEPNLILSVFY